VTTRNGQDEQRFDREVARQLSELAISAPGGVDKEREGVGGWRQCLAFRGYRSPFCIGHYVAPHCSLDLRFRILKPNFRPTRRRDVRFTTESGHRTFYWTTAAQLPRGAANRFRNTVIAVLAVLTVAAAGSAPFAK
jgi:hypothetical protein